MKTFSCWGRDNTIFAITDGSSLPFSLKVDGELVFGYANGIIVINDEWTCLQLVQAESIADALNDVLVGCGPAVVVVTGNK